MLFESTRGNSPRVTSKQAILQGLAPDGGLYVPVNFPQGGLPDFSDMSYARRAFYVTRPFLSDYDEEELAGDIADAYSMPRFSHPAVAPLRQIHEDLYALELWHGPTMAFKDMALQLLPRLLTRAARGLDKEIIILAATSGDTGKAALAGFSGVEGTRCVVFYPKNGVSHVQELQMLTQAGDNVHVIGVNGDFDDAQNGVKAIFRDKELATELSKNGQALSSANSINWGRLAPQIAYYISAFADLAALGHNGPVNFVVPTGNFGNILAAYYASRLGLPINRLICASNKNNVLTEFIKTGVYDRNRPLYATKSPSMDILVSSNLERYLYWESDSAHVNAWMDSLTTTGRYDIGSAFDMAGLFWSGWASDDEGREAIASLYREYEYLADPHTAVGYSVYSKYRGDNTKTVLVSTASPYKFGREVAGALFGDSETNEFECCRAIERHTGVLMPDSLRELENAPVLHNTVCDPSGMSEALMKVISRTRNYAADSHG